VVWAAVLVPIWLRRHDAVTESRSMDRFSTAMRVLSRRPPPGGGARYVVLPPGAPREHGSPASGRPRRPVRRSAEQASRLEARGQLRLRRARALLILLGVAGLTFLLALAGVTGWSLQLLADLLLVGYVIHLRLQVVKVVAQSPRRPVPRPEAGHRAGAAPQPAAATVSAPVPARAPALDGALVEQGWAPNPVPLPTYVTAPVVHRPSRQPLPPPEAEKFEPDDAEIEVLFERRWAVND